MKINQATEHQEQSALIKWWQYYSAGLPVLLFSVPNMGKRSVITGKLFKDEGMIAGIPDLFLAQPRLGFGGLFIEMKKRKGYTISVAQIKVMQRLRQSGYAVTVSRGWDEAKESISQYMIKQEFEFNIENQDFVMKKIK